MSAPELIFATVVKGRPHELIKNVRLHSPHADRSIVVLHGECKESEEFLNSEECRKMNVQWGIINVPYHPPTLRNAYLSRLPVGSWCFHMDCDEFLEEPGLFQMRALISRAEELGMNRVAFLAHDIRIGVDGQVWDNLSNYHNPVLFKVFPGIQWAGAVHGGIYTPNVAPVVAQAPYRYFHIKTSASEFLRATHNAWNTSAVADNRTDDPDWKYLKSLWAKHGFETYPQFYDAMVAGNLHEDFKEWFILHRNHDNSEFRSYFVVYMILLHPEENTYLAGNRDFPYDKNRKPYAGEMSF